MKSLFLLHLLFLSFVSLANAFKVEPLQVSSATMKKGVPVNIILPDSY